MTVPTEQEIKRAIAVRAIEADSLFACRVVQSLKRSTPVAGVTTTFCIYNYFSLFLYESWRYLSSRVPEIASQLSPPNATALARSRHSTKLFDDNASDRGVDGVIDYFVQHIGQAHSARFLGNTWLRPARFLETDLGLYKYKDRIVCTTHGATFGIGVEPQVLLTSGSSEMMAISTDYGKYFGSFWDGADLGPSFLDALDGAQFQSKNVRASRYYARGFTGPTFPGVNALLGVFHAALNFLDIMLSQDENPASRQTILKMQFVTLYHIVSSLKSLRDTYASRLDRRSLDYITQVVDDGALDLFGTSAARTFRNTLVHYGLASDVQLSDIMLDEPHYGLIEKYIPGYTYDSLHVALAEQISRTAEIFAAWA